MSEDEAGLSRRGRWIEESAAKVAPRLDVPAGVCKRPALVLISGLPGSGKSYFANQLGRRIPAVVIRTDEVRKILFPEPTYKGWESGVVYLTSQRLVRDYLLSGKNVIFDATNLTESGRKQVYRIAAAADARLTIVETVAPESTIRRRLRRRSAGSIDAYKSDATWPVYLEMKRRRQPIKAEHWTVDTSKELGPQLDLIVDSINEGEEQA